MPTDPDRIPSRRRTVLLNVFSNYVGKFISVGAWFLITPFMLDRLQDDLYGLWVLVVSLVAYGTLLEFGIAGAVTKYVAEYRVKADTAQMSRLVTTAFVIYCVMGLLVILLSVGLAFIFPRIFNIAPQNESVAFWLVILAGTGVGLSIPATTTYAVLRGLQRFDLLNMLSVASTVLTISLYITVLLAGGSVISVTLVTVTVTLIMQIPAVWFIRRTTPELRIGRRYLDRTLFRTVATFSSSLFLINVGGQLETKSDEVVIGAFLPVSAVTPYNLARRLSTLPQMITDQFLSLLLPMASELNASDDQAGLRQLYLTSTRLTLAVFLPVGIALIKLAGPVLVIWVGADYLEYAYLVGILVMASLIDTSQWPAGLILQGMARHRLMAFNALGTGVANLLLSLLLVRDLGLTGVALGTLIPTTAACLLVVLPYAMRNINVTGLQLLRYVLIPSLTPVIPTILTVQIVYDLLPPFNLLTILFAGGSGVLVYGVLYLNMSVCNIERQVFASLAGRSLRLVTVSFKRS